MHYQIKYRVNNFASKVENNVLLLYAYYKVHSFWQMIVNIKTQTLDLRSTAQTKHLFPNLQMQILGKHYQRTVLSYVPKKDRY